MKIKFLLSFILFAFLIIGCGGKEEKKDGFSVDRQSQLKKPLKPFLL